MSYPNERITEFIEVIWPYCYGSGSKYSTIYRGMIGGSVGVST